MVGLTPAQGVLARLAMAARACKTVAGHDPCSFLTRVVREIIRWTAAILVLVGAPYAGFTALVHHASWPAHWVEPVILAALPAACIPFLTGNPNPRSCPGTWSALVVIWALGVLSSPHTDLSGVVSVGHNLRVFVNEISLVPFGGPETTPYRIARFSMSALAMAASVSVTTYQLMAFLQRFHDLARSRAPARPVRVLSDAEWATTDDVRRRFSTEGGIIVGELTDPRKNRDFDAGDRESWGRQGKGRLITLDPGKGNAHSLIFSGSGSYKSSGVAIPNALTYAGPLIVIDPKGEIYDLTAGVRRASGRRPWLITAESGLDPIKLLTTVCPNDGTVFSDLAEFSLITSGEDRSDAAAFFHRKALRLLTALLAYIHDLGKAGNVPAAAYRSLARPPDAIRAEFLEAADEYDKGDSDKDYVSVGLAEMAHTEDRQFSSIVATVVNGLEWAGKKTTRGFVESGDLSGPELVARALDPKTDIYIRIPTEVSQNAPEIARLLIGSLVRAIRVSVFRAADGELDHRLFIIDEARALRRMDHLVSMRDEARAYGIHLMQIFQSYQQLVECYGSHGAGAWENSVDAVVIGPVQNAVQAQALSRMIGRRTVVTASSSRQRSSQIFMPFSGSAGSSVSSQLRETELIQPSELRKLPPESAIILTTGMAPILASKAIWFTRSDMQERIRYANSEKDGVGAHRASDTGTATDRESRRREAHAEIEPGQGLLPEPEQPDRPESTEIAEERNESGSEMKTETGSTAGGKAIPGESVDDSGPRDPSLRLPPGDETGTCREPNEHPENPEEAGQTRQGEEPNGPRSTDADARPDPEVQVAGNQDGCALACDLPEDLGAIETDMARLLPRAKRMQKANPDQRSDHDGVDHGKSERNAAVDAAGDFDPAHEKIEADGSRTDPRGAREGSVPSDCAETGRMIECQESAEEREQEAGLVEKSDGVVPAATKDGGPVSSGTGSIAVLPKRGRLWRSLRSFVRAGARMLSMLLFRGAGQAGPGRLIAERRPGADPGHEVNVELAGPAWQSEVCGGEIEHSSNDHERGTCSPTLIGDLRDSERNGGDLPELRAAIHRNIVYETLIERSIALDANMNTLARRALSEPFLRQPQGTSARIVLPNVLGPGIDHPDYLSIVFIPDDRSSPIHRILVDESGKIAGTAGPYCRAS